MLAQLSRISSAWVLLSAGLLLGMIQPAMAAPRLQPRGTPSAAPETLCAARFPRARLCARLEWTRKQSAFEMPTAEDAGEFILRLEGAPQSQELAVRLWMPEMGHGSEPVRVTQERDRSGKSVPGVYRVSQVLFSMKGAWEIQLELRPSRERAAIRVQVPEGIK